MLKYKLKRKLITCVCDTCGCEFEKPESEYLRNIALGRHNFCSRSCSGKFITDKKLNSYKSSNHSDISKYCDNRKDKFTPFKETFRRAKRRFKEFNISLQDLKDQWELQNGKCAYTNLQLVLPIGNKSNDIRYTASLDRIDSSKGYIKGNIQFVATPINYMKSSMSDDDFKNYLKEIALLLS